MASRVNIASANVENFSGRKVTLTTNNVNSPTIKDYCNLEVLILTPTLS